MRKLLLALAATLLVSVVSLSALAQGTSSLTGTVYDQTGAVIPGAKITATHVATNRSYTTDTSGAGLYRFPTLPVGTYQLKVVAQGFRTVEVGNIVLTVAQTVRHDVTLEPGVIEEVVTVQGEGAQLVQTTQSDLSVLINARDWEDLPLEQRNSNVFVDLLPGAVPDAFAGSTRGAAVNGARGGMGNFMVEGMDNNDQGQGGRGAVIAGGITAISPDAIQEYRLISSDFSAQYGKGGGFVTDAVIKSGSNQFHGSVYEYNRVQRLAANSFFSNRDGLKDARVRNQFGASVGGPVIKDKSFFFFSWETHIFRESTPTTAVSTTKQFLDFVDSGDFARFHESDPNGLCMQNLGEACPGAFANSSSLGPLFKKQFNSQFFPLATTNFSNVSGGFLAGGIQYPVPIFGDVSALDATSLNENRIAIKFDQLIAGADKLSYTFLFEDSDTTGSIGGGDAAIGVPFLAPGRSILTGLSYTRTFSPTIIGDFKFGYLRHRRDFPNAPGLEDSPSVVTAFDPLGVGFGNASALPQFFTENQYQVQGHISIVSGAHTFRTGAEYRRTTNGSAFEALKNGLFLPYGIEELATDMFFGDEADLALFGAPRFGSWFFAQASVNPITSQLPEFYRGFRANEFAGYFQDDWRVTPRLTLNLGLRWEYFGPPHNFRKGLDSNFFFGNAITPIQSDSTNPFFPFTSPTSARVATGGFRQVDQNIWAKDTNNFAPRFGFAWDVFGTQKFVVRGGGGVFYDRIWNNLFENIRFNPPFFSFSFFGTLINGLPGGALSSPGVYTVPFTSTSAFNVPGIVPSARHMDENLVIPYVQQYHLGIQWEFARDFVFEANYISTLGRKLTGLIDINTFNGRIRGGDSQRPLTSLGGDNFRTNAFKSVYHGAQFIVRKRFSRGLQFVAHYTVSKAIDEVSDAFNKRGGLRPTNNFNIALDRGLADFDLRQRFLADFVYDLPVFKGNRWLGGWTISSIITLQSGRGFPLNHTGQDPNGDGYRTDRLVFLGSGDYNDLVKDNQSPADGYFDTSQFTTIDNLGGASACSNGVVIDENTWWCDGQVGKNVLAGPGYANVDFSITKKFRITEDIGVKFLANFFNLFNRSNFGLPSGNLNSSAFGRSLSTFDPRIIQFALRLDW